MAQQDDPSTRAYHISLVRAGYDEDSAKEFHGLVSEDFKDRFRQVTWESIYKRAVGKDPKLSRLCEYMEQKTENLKKAFCF